MGAAKDADRRRPKTAKIIVVEPEPETRKAKPKPKATKAKPQPKKTAPKPPAMSRAAMLKLQQQQAAAEAEKAEAEATKTSRQAVTTATGTIRKIQKNLRSAVKQLNISSIDPTASSLLCREKQVSIVIDFLRDDGHPSLQLFGMPGTGKTAAVKKAITTYSQSPEFRKGARISVLFLNGYILQRPADVFTALLRHLAQHRLTAAQAHKLYEVPPNEAAQLIEGYFQKGWGSKSKPPCCVIVVDEIDKCCESSARTLFKLVDWLTQPEAYCKLITMANAMQLPERLDAKTRSRLNTSNRVTFPPYTPAQLKSILLQRIGIISDPPVCSDSSVEYITKQLGLHNGDARRLLQITASAAHDVLRNLDSLTEGSPLFDPKPQMTKSAVDAELSRVLAAASISADHRTVGIISIRHLHSLTRSVLHDRFPDFLASIEAPLVFLILFLIAKESLKLSQINEEGLGNRGMGATKASARTAALLTTLTVDKLYNLTKAVVDTHSDTLLNSAIKADERELMRSLEDELNGTSVLSKSFGYSTFLSIIELLREVGYLELAVLDPVSGNEMLVGCALDSVRISYPVTITMLHPSDDIILRCERHSLFNVVGGVLRHKSSM